MIQKKKKPKHHEEEEVKKEDAPSPPVQHIQLEAALLQSPPKLQTSDLCERVSSRRDDSIVKSRYIPQPSKYLAEYRDIINAGVKLPADHIFKDHSFRKPNEDLQQKYRAHLLTRQQLSLRQHLFDIRLIYVGFRATIATYLVELGRFRLTVHLLNLPMKAPKMQDRNKQLVGTGSFGTVVRKEMAGIKFAAKLSKFSKDRSIKQNIDEIISQVAVAKLCAMFKIGPEIETRVRFDLIVFEDGIQFHQEECISVDERLQRQKNRHQYDQEMALLDRDVRKCLKVLHSLHIAHRDIKMGNILWSQSYKRYVLCDFGVAEYVRECVGEISPTAYAGTYQFMGPEMRQLREVKVGEVDLYYNDAYGWKRSIDELRKRHKNTHFKEYSKQPQYAGFNMHQVNVREEENCWGNDYLDQRSSNSEGSRRKARLAEVHTGSQHSESLIQPPEIVIPSDTVYKKPDSFEFYRLLFLATSPQEHECCLSQYLQELDAEQLDFLEQCLKQSLNKPKMEKVIKELQALPKEVGSPWEHWQESLKQAFKKNFDEHKPQTARYSPFDNSWIGNLKRLLGQSDWIMRLQAKLKKQGNTFDHQAAAKTACDEMRVYLYRKLESLGDSIQRHSKSYCLRYRVSQQDIKQVVRYMSRLSFLSYDSKECLLIQFLRVLQQPTNSVLFPECLASIICKKDATSSLLHYIYAQQSLDWCVFLFEYYYFLAPDNSEQFLKVCEQLLKRLQQQSLSFSFRGIICVRRIQLYVMCSKAKLPHNTIKQHLNYITPLLQRYCTRSDAHTIIATYNSQLYFYHQFNFPVEDIRIAHFQFQHYCQFYSEVYYTDKDEYLINSGSYIGGVPISTVKLSQRDQLMKRGLYRSVMKNELQQNQTWLTAENIVANPALSVIATSNHAFLMLQLGKYRQAEKIFHSLGEIHDKAIDLMTIDQKLYYLQIKARIDRANGRYEQGYRICVQALQQAGQLSKDIKRVHNIKLLQGELSCLLGRPQECIDLLEEVKYQQVSAIIAEAYRAVGRIDDSRDYCNYVIRQLCRSVLPDHEFVARVIMMRIVEELNQTEEQLNHAWAIVTKTTVLGDQRSCIAYTCLIRYYRPLVGNEVLSLISYARKQTDPPSDRVRERMEIAEELFEQPVPAGQLPLDMPTKDFIKLAQERIAQIPQQQQVHCYQFKLKLLSVMERKFEDQPQYRLLYVRTMLECQLHRLAAGEIEQVRLQFPRVLQDISAFVVDKADRLQKELLACFARNLAKKIKVI